MTRRSIEWLGDKIKFIDQTKLPLKLECVETGDYKVIAEAIRNLQVRGAPLIGITAAFGVAVALKNYDTSDKADFFDFYRAVSNEIGSTRPTARNLFFALERIDKCIEKSINKSIKEIKQSVEKEALDILYEDREIAEKIGINGQKVIPDNCTLLTHCNTGFLVTGGIGTALAVVYKARQSGKNIKVYADETRPLLQGARLTTWELMNENIDVTLICDSAAASLMKKGVIDIVIVGADRIAKNGDTANKIGTYSVAVLCREHNVPFYIAAPYSTFDMSLKSGDEIKIEERESFEVTHMFGGRTAPENVKVYNPAFDVTPAEFITGFITEVGVFKPPYGDWSNLKNTWKSK